MSPPQSSRRPGLGVGRPSDALGVAAMAGSRGMRIFSWLNLAAAWLVIGLSIAGLLALAGFARTQDIIDPSWITRTLLLSASRNGVIAAGLIACVGLLWFELRCPNKLWTLSVQAVIGGVFLLAAGAAMFGLWVDLARAVTP